MSLPTTKLDHIAAKLLEYGKKRIDLPELLKILGDSGADSAEAYTDVKEIAELGFVFPVKKSGTNGNRQYPLYLRYHICLEKTVSEDVLAGIRALHPRLLQTGYLEANPEKYEAHAQELQQLSRYLFSDWDREPISRKERSFAIFRREKVLDGGEMKSLLKNLGFSQEELCFYDTPEDCFHDYIRRRGDKVTLLICENKDVWFDLRKLMAEDGLTSLFGCKLDGVVYGGGNRISEKTGAVQAYVRYMRIPEVRFLYWGDIDRYGFEIYRRTTEANPDLEMELFVPAYRRMLIEAERLGLPGMEMSPAGNIAYKDVSGLFPDSLENNVKHLLQRLLQENRLIPQEILSAAILRREAGYDEE